MVPLFWSRPAGLCHCPLICCASPHLLLRTKNSIFPEFIAFTTASSRKWSVPLPHSSWCAHNGTPALYCPAWFSRCPCELRAHLPVSMPRTGGTPNKLPSVLVVEFPPTKAFPSCPWRCFYSPVGAFLGYRQPTLPYPCFSSLCKGGEGGGRGAPDQGIICLVPSRSEP